MRRFLLGFLLVLSFCGWSWAGNGVYTLSGMVVTGLNPAEGNVFGKGDPLGGVEIEVEGMPFRTVSSANGYFAFEDLPDGEYRLLARKPGFNDTSMRVRVNYVGMSSRCQILMSGRGVIPPGGGTAALPGDLFVAYSRKPDDQSGIESSPFQNLWQKILAAGGTVFPRQEDLPMQPKGWGQSYLMNPITGEENCVMVFPFANPSRSGFVPLKVMPYWLCFDQSGRFLYVSGAGKMLLVLDAKQGFRLVRNLPMNGVITDLRLSRDGRYVTASLMGGKPGVVLVDTSTTLPAGFLPTESSPWSACLVGSRVFTCHGDALHGEVMALDARTGTLVGRCKVGNRPTGLEATPDGSRVLVACSGNACVSVVDSLSVTELGRIAVDVLPQKLAISPDGSRCVVSNKENNTVSVIDLQASQVVGTTDVGKAPVGICYSRNGHHVYVACRDSGVIMVLDGKTGQVLHTTIPLPHAVPTGLTILP